MRLFLAESVEGDDLAGGVRLFRRLRRVGLGGGGRGFLVGFEAFERNRLELQAELKDMQKLWGIPFILVTHDPEEAKTLGTQVLFIEKGRQVERPASW